MLLLITHRIRYLVFIVTLYNVLTFLIGLPFIKKKKKIEKCIINAVRGS
jgi:hypothetical protein